MRGRINISLAVNSWWHRLPKLDPVFHSASVSVWFPDGVWYDFFHDWKYEGRGKLTVFRTSQDIPVFARAGAIIPMDAQPQTGVDLPEMLDWHLFPGDNRSFVLREGEGAGKVETRRNSRLG